MFSRRHNRQCRNPRCAVFIAEDAWIPLCASCRAIGAVCSALTAVLGLLARVLGFFVLLFLVTPAADAKTVPRAALQYQRALLGNARAVWGLNAPIAVFAAQVHQESGWRPDAKSAYAGGLTQFTPATATDMGRWYSDLADVDVYNPAWSLRALVRYDKRLLDRVRASVSEECDAIAMMLVQYNGGPGWLDRDRKLAASRGANQNRWWGHVEQHSARAAWAFRENRQYPRRILFVHQALYLGWGPGTCTAVARAAGVA